MNRQEKSAFLANCKVSEMMGYCDLGDMGTVVIAPDGRKFRYTNDQLDKAESRAKIKAAAAEIELSDIDGKKPKPRRTTKRQAATKAKPAKKLAAKKSTKPITKPTTKSGSKAGNSR